MNPYVIPRHAGAGIAFLGVELNDALILLASLFIGLLCGPFFGTVSYLAVPAGGYVLNRFYLEWRNKSLPGQTKAYLFSIGLASYSRALTSRGVVFVGDGNIINPSSRERGV